LRRRVSESGGSGVAVSEVLELEVTLAEGADDAVFGRGAGIDRQRHARTGKEIVEIAVSLAEITVPGRDTVGAAIKGSVGAQIAADLDAGVGAGDVEEARAVKRADPDIFYRFGLDRKVGRFFCVPPLRAIKPAAELRMSVRAVFIFK